MGAGHGHLDAATGSIPVGRWARIAVLALIALSGLLALLGVLRWWPDGARLQHAQGLVPVVAGGVHEVHAELVEVRTACAGTGAGGSASCGTSSARVLDGTSAGRTVPISLAPDVASTGLRRGDRVLLLDPSGASGTAGAGFEFYRADRGTPMVWLAVLFVVVVVLVVWRRGVLALVSLGFAGLVVAGFLLPALLSGQPAVPVTLAAAVLILIVMLYLTHGFSMRTSVALVGAIAGVALSALFAWAWILGARLGGLGDESAELLTANVRWIDVQQLVVASVIVAGIGTLNDVTVTQASALWELREASPAMSRGELFRRSMRIGRDHVASTVYTLVFAYLGTALVLLVAVQLYRGSLIDFATAESVAEEIVRTLVGGIALVLAMPITTGIAVLVTAPPPEADERDDPEEWAWSAHEARRAPVPLQPARRSSDPLRSRYPGPWEVD